MKTILLGLLLTSFSAFAAITEVDRSEFPTKSILKDSGFETGKAAWSTSGSTISIVTSGSNLLYGKASATWDASATTMTLTSAAVTVPKGLYGQNGEASVVIQTPSGTATHLLQVIASGNTLVSGTVLSSTLPVKTSLNFVFPTSGTIQVRLMSQADEPLIAIDDFYLGKATNIGTVSQATLYGGISYPSAASCLWSITNSAFSNFATDNDCTGRILYGSATGPADSTGNRTPSVTFSTLPAGQYLVIATGKFSADNASGALQEQSYRLSDGTNNSSAVTFALPTGDSVRPAVQTLTWSPLYTSSQTNVSFHVQGAASANGDVFITNSATGDKLDIMVYRFPLTNETVWSPNVGPIYAAIDATSTATTFNTSSASYVDVNSGIFGAKTYYGQAQSPSSTSDFAMKIPSFPVGDYYFSVSGNVTTTSASTTCGMRLYDGTNTIIEGSAPLNASAIAYDQYGNINGVYKKTSATTDTTIKLQLKSVGGGACYFGANVGNVSISMIPLSRGITMPILLGGVISGATGASRFERAEISSTGVVSSESGDWLNGNCSSASSTFTCPIFSGLFSNPPVCQATIKGSSTGIINIPSTTNTSAQVRTSDATGTASDRAFSLTCYGDK